MYDQAKTRATVSVEDEDKAPCFSDAPMVRYYEAPLAAGRQKMDIKRAWEQRLNEVSAVFKTCPELSEGSASFSFQILRTYFVKRGELGSAEPGSHPGDVNGIPESGRRDGIAVEQGLFCLHA